LTTADNLIEIISWMKACISVLGVVMCFVEKIDPLTLINLKYLVVSDIILTFAPTNKTK
jgi:hypothetical protein